MSFKIGDKVTTSSMSGFFEVLEVKDCDDKCEHGGEIFRIKYPDSNQDDWLHSSEWELAAAHD